jgi:hypothetical protein
MGMMLAGAVTGGERRGAAHRTVTAHRGRRPGEGAR